MYIRSKYDWKKKVQAFAKKFTDEQWDMLCLDPKFLRCLSPEGLDLLRADVIANDLLPKNKHQQLDAPAMPVKDKNYFSTVGDAFDNLTLASDQLSQRKSVER